MATHRAPVEHRRPILPVLGSVLADMGRNRGWMLIGVLFHLVLVLAMAAVLYAASGWPAATVWLVLGLVETAWQAARWGAEERASVVTRQHETRMMDLLASAPGGAPIVADARAHCGCTHRYAWDELKGEWLQVTLTEANRFCPLVEGYNS